MLKRLLLFTLLLMPLPLFSIAPKSSVIGNVQIKVEEGSITEKALQAVTSDYTEEWLETYTENPLFFGEAYSELLSNLLPLSNVIAGMEENSAVDVMSLDTGAALSLVFQNDYIAAVYPLIVP